MLYFLRVNNNDLRYVQNTKSIARLSFDEATELSYFGAKIFHPQSVFPARKYNVPVRLLDTMNISAVGTLILREATNQNQIIVIAAKGYYYSNWYSVLPYAYGICFFEKG